MDFDFSDDQEMLRDTVRRWVDKDYGFEHRRGIVKSGGHSAATWQQLAELGLLGLQVPEAHGGMGFGAVDAMVVMEELGRGIVLEPVAAVSLVAAGLLRRASDEALQSRWLPAIASGEALVVLAHQERAARYRLDHVETRAVQSGDTWQLSGRKSLVPVGDKADAYIVPARVSGEVGDASGIALFLVERTADGVTTRGYGTQDGARAAELTLANAPAALVSAAGSGDDSAYASLELAADTAMAALCAEGVGVMDRLLALTVEYMNTRKQFGVVISSFQALKHRVADVKMQVELARSMSYYATLKLDETPAARRRAIAQAKYQLNQSARFVGQQCVQLHGGIGVTDEYVGSHYFKRLTMIELAFGDSNYQIGEVAARMQDTAGVFA